MLLDPADLKTSQSAQIGATPLSSSKSVVTPVISQESKTSAVPRQEVSEKPVAESKPAKASGKAAKRQAAAQPAGEAAGADSYQVKSGDTLAKIAGQVKPEGISLDQMLVALYRSNSNAFVGKNMNRLRAGQILKVPDAASVEAISNKEAHGVVVAQAADFNAYRNKLAGQVAAAEPQKAPEAKQSAAGKITAKVEEKPTAVNESKDKLKLSKPGAPSEKAAAGMSAEDRIAKDKALTDANTRVKELERNVNDLQKLLELKNKALEEQQKQAELAKKTAAATPAKPVASTPAASAPAAAQPAVTPAVATPVTAAPAAATPSASAAAAAPAASTNVASTPVASPSASAVAASAPATSAPAASIENKNDAEAPPVVAAASAPEIKPVVKPVPVVKKVAPPPPPPEPSFIEENWLPMLGGGGLLAALGGFLVFNKKRREKKKSKDFDESIISGEDSSLTANSLFGSTGGQSVDTSNSVFNSSFTPSASQLDTNEVDPVAEADVYIAYGRDAQAEEILKEALRTQPERNAVRLKLLEIYANRKDVRSFEAQATELYSMTKGEGEDWVQAAALGAALDPSNPMYAGGKSAASAPAAVADQSADLTAPTMPMDEGLDALLNTTQQPGAAAEGLETLGANAAYFANTTSEPLNVAVPEAPVIEAPAISEAVVAAPKTAASSLDFDLAGMDIKPAASEPVKPVAAADLDIGVLDFGLDLKKTDADSTLNGSIESATAMNVDVGKDDLAFMSAGMPDLGTVAKMPEVHIEKPVEPMNFDLSGINLDLSPQPVQAAPAVASAAAADFVAAVQEPFDVGADAPDLSFDINEAPTADSEMATKLDLAIAYQEIGDKDGARELLDEVIKGGTAEQSTKAKSLLASIA
ncbi:MAG: LysM peptidoglycan-binding domain-containing protein [Proteobacteria bacterium]|nr:LysM peptidoglycan-binding domain-containing protein [Pseudomonadota bacterium]